MLLIPHNLESMKVCIKAKNIYGFVISMGGIEIDPTQIKVSYKYLHLAHLWKLIDSWNN
jgi:hypothetical protein